MADPEMVVVKPVASQPVFVLHEVLQDEDDAWPVAAAHDTVQSLAVIVDVHSSVEDDGFSVDDAFDLSEGSCEGSGFEFELPPLMGGSGGNGIGPGNGGRPPPPPPQKTIHFQVRPPGPTGRLT